MSTAAQSVPAGAGDARKGGFAQNRRLAAGILAAAVVIFTPIGAWRSLSRAVDKVEAQFYTGVDGRGAVADYIDDSLDACLGLISVGENYDGASEATQALRTARETVMRIMESPDPDLSDIHISNDALAGSFANLKGILMNLELSEQDASDLDYYATQFEGAQGAVNHSGYNEAAEAFTKNVYNSFPTRLIGSLSGVDAPQQFK